MWANTPSPAPASLSAFACAAKKDTLQSMGGGELHSYTHFTGDNDDDDDVAPPNRYVL